MSSFVIGNRDFVYATDPGMTEGLRQRSIGEIYAIVYIQMLPASGFGQISMTDKWDKKIRIYGPTFLLIILPTMVFANAGSPMMWFGFLHLLILNAVIGLVESLILARHKIENRTWMIILANYVSMFAGLAFIAPYFSTLVGNDDFWGGQTNYGAYKLNGFLAGMGTAFMATLIIEFPFFYFATKDENKRSEVINPYLIANLSTNLVMFIIYFLIAKPGST